jgi:hypothetical protein
MNLENKNKLIIYKYCNLNEKKVIHLLLLSEYRNIIFELISFTGIIVNRKFLKNTDMKY